MKKKALFKKAVVWGLSAALLNGSILGAGMLVASAANNSVKLSKSSISLNIKKTKGTVKYETVKINLKKGKDIQIKKAVFKMNKKGIVTAKIKGKTSPILTVKAKKKGTTEIKVSVTYTYKKGKKTKTKLQKLTLKVKVREIEENKRTSKPKKTTMPTQTAAPMTTPVAEVTPGCSTGKPEFSAPAPMVTPGCSTGKPESSASNPTGTPTETPLPVTAAPAAVPEETPQATFPVTAPTETPEPASTEAPEPTATPVPIVDIVHRNESDVAALKKIIAGQRALGATFSEDLDNSQYVWDDDGYLIQIEWNKCSLGSDITFSELTHLKKIYCAENNINSLIIAGNAELEEMEVNDNSISLLNLSKNKALKKMNCSNNNLENLDVYQNVNLVEISCSDNNISSLSLENCVSLEFLQCVRNKISSLDTNANTRLKNWFADRIT